MQQFPNEKVAIAKFVDLMQKSEKAFYGAVLLKSLPLPISRFLTKTGLYRLFDKGYHKMAQKSVRSALAELTDNPDNAPGTSRPTRTPSF